MLVVIFALVSIGSGAAFVHAPALLNPFTSFWSRATAAVVRNGRSEDSASGSPHVPAAASSVRVALRFRGLFARLPALPTFSCPRLPRARTRNFLPAVPAMSWSLRRRRPSTQEHEEYKVEDCGDKGVDDGSQHDGAESPIKDKASPCCRSPACRSPLNGLTHHTTSNSTASPRVTTTSPIALRLRNAAMNLCASGLSILGRLRPSQRRRRTPTLDDSSPGPKYCLPLPFRRLGRSTESKPAPLLAYPTGTERVDDLTHTLVLHESKGLQGTLGRGAEGDGQGEGRFIHRGEPLLGPGPNKPTTPVEHTQTDTDEAPKNTWRSKLKFPANLNMNLDMNFDVSSRFRRAVKPKAKQDPPMVQRCACCYDPQVQDDHLKACTDCGQRVCITKCIPYLPAQNFYSTACFVCVKAPAVRKWVNQCQSDGLSLTLPPFPCAWLTMFKLLGRRDVLGAVYDLITVAEEQSLAELHAQVAQTPVTLSAEDVEDTWHASTLGCVSSSAIHRSLPRSKDIKLEGFGAKVGKACDGIKKRFKNKPEVRYFTMEQQDQAERQQKGYDAVRWVHPSRSNYCAGRCGNDCNRGTCARAVHCRECGGVSCVAGSCDWVLLPVKGLDGLHKVCANCSDKIHRQRPELLTCSFDFVPADGDEDIPIMPFVAIEGYKAMRGAGVDPVNHPLKAVDIGTHEALSEPLPRQRPEADYLQGIVLTRAVGNLLASCHNAVSSLAPLHEVVGLPLPGDDDDAILSDLPAVLRRLRHRLWLNWGDAAYDISMPSPLFMHQDALPMAAALNTLDLFLRHEQHVMEAGTDEPMPGPWLYYVPRPHKMLGLDFVCINAAREKRAWHKVMIKKHTDKRVLDTGETAAAAAENAAKHNDAHDELNETHRRKACLHEYAKKIVPQVPHPSWPKFAPECQMRNLWALVIRPLLATRRGRQAPV